MKMNASHVILCAAVAVSCAGCQTVREKFDLSDQLGWTRGNAAHSNSIAQSPIVSPFQTASLANEVRPDQKADVQMVMGRAMEREGKLEAAQEVYLNVIKMDPSRADAFHRLAILSEMLGDEEKTLANYRAALDRGANTSDFFCDFGYSLYLRKRWQDAERNLRHALSLKPDNKRAHVNLGLLLARTGRQNEAFQEFHLADCSEAEARANVAHALMLENRWDEAGQQIHQAFATNSASPPVQARMKKMTELISRVRADAGGDTPLSTGAEKPHYSVGQVAYAAQKHEHAELRAFQWSPSGAPANTEFQLVEPY